MSTRRLLTLFEIALFFSHFLSGFSLGQSSVWEGNFQDVGSGEFRWSDSNNWDANGVPQTSTAIFNSGANTNASSTVWLASGGTSVVPQDTANVLNFNSDAKAYTIRGDSPFAGTSGLGFVGTNARITNASASTQTFNAGVTFFGTGTRRLENSGAGQTSYVGTVTSTSGDLAISKINSGSILFNTVDASTRGITISNTNTTGAVTFNGSVTANSISSDLLNTGAVTFSSSVNANTINNFGSGAINFASVNASTGTISNSGAGQVAITGAVANSSGLLTVTKSGTGALVFNSGVTSTNNNLSVDNQNGTGAITFAGTVTANSITNAGDGAKSFNSVNTGSISNSGAGQVNVTGLVSKTSPGALVVNKTGTGAMNFTGGISSTNGVTVTNSDSTGLVAFNSNVSNAITVAAGPGTVRLGSLAANTFSGPVNVSGRVDGVGAIGGLLTLESGGRYAPGADGTGVGTQSVNSLAFNTGSTFVWQLNGEGNAAGTNFDNVTLSSGLTIGNGVFSELNISNVSDSFWNSNQIWNVFTGATTGTFSSPSIFSSIALTGSSVPVPARGAFSWTSTGNNVSLNFITAVPEPSSMALLGVAGVVGGLFARRRAKKNKV